MEPDLVTMAYGVDAKGSIDMARDVLCFSFLYTASLMSVYDTQSISTVLWLHGNELSA